MSEETTQRWLKAAKKYEVVATKTALEKARLEQEKFARSKEGINKALDHFIHNEEGNAAVALIKASAQIVPLCNIGEKTLYLQEGWFLVETTNISDGTYDTYPPRIERAAEFIIKCQKYFPEIYRELVRQLDLLAKNTPQCEKTEDDDDAPVGR